MINETLVITNVRGMNTNKGIAIYQICEKLGVPVDENSRFIASVLRKHDFTKEHTLTSLEPGKRAYLWFSKVHIDPKDKQIKALQEEIEHLKTRIKQLEGLETASYIQKLQSEAMDAANVPEALSEQLESVSGEVSEEELEALRIALSEEF